MDGRRALRWRPPTTTQDSLQFQRKPYNSWRFQHGNSVVLLGSSIATQPPCRWRKRDCSESLRDSTHFAPPQYTLATFIWSPRTSHRYPLPNNICDIHSSFAVMTLKNKTKHHFAKRASRRSFSIFVSFSSTIYLLSCFRAWVVSRVLIFKRMFLTRFNVRLNFITQWNS